MDDARVRMEFWRMVSLHHNLRRRNTEVIPEITPFFLKRDNYFYSRYEKTATLGQYFFFVLGLPQFAWSKTGRKLWTMFIALLATKRIRNRTTRVADAPCESALRGMKWLCLICILMSRVFYAYFISSSRWWAGPWQPCSKTCGSDGEKRRSVLCVQVKVNA